ncbi:Os01g0632700, partial [Oryza sativa Japonica Group]
NPASPSRTSLSPPRPHPCDPLLSHLPLLAAIESVPLPSPPSLPSHRRLPPVADPIRRLAAQLRLRSPHSLSQTRRLLIPVLRRNLRPPPRRHRSPSPVQRRAHPSTTTTTTTPPADPDIAAVPPPAKSVRPPPQPASPPLSLHRGNRHASPQPPPIRSHAAVPPPLKGQHQRRLADLHACCPPALPTEQV